MKQLWLAVILLATIIFLWQAGRIWLGQNISGNETATNVAPANEVVVNQSSEPELNTEPQTHTVAAGETLNSIGLKYNLRWTAIAALNGLTEDAALQIGQVLALPITVSGHIIDAETINVSATDAQNAQNDATFGGITWRLDPVEVTRQTAPSDSGIRHDTSLVVVERDDQAGTARIQADVDGRLTVVTLSQPITKGASGVWFVVKTETYRWPS